MKKNLQPSIYLHIKLVKTSFFVMAIILMVSLLIQFISDSDFKGIPFLIFGIGVCISALTLFIRILIDYINLR